MKISGDKVQGKMSGFLTSTPSGALQREPVDVVRPEAAWRRCDIWRRRWRQWSRDERERTTEEMRWLFTACDCVTCLCSVRRYITVHFFYSNFIIFFSVMLY